MTPLARRLFPLACLGVLLSCGCGPALGPETMVTTHLAGKLHCGDRPIGPGWLEFLPIEGTIGRLRSAVVGPDGSFQADKVPVGRVAIRLVGRPFRSSDDPGYDSAVARAQRGFEIRRTIGASATRLDLDLQGPWRPAR